MMARPLMYQVANRGCRHLQTPSILQPTVPGCAHRDLRTREGRPRPTQRGSRQIH